MIELQIFLDTASVEEIKTFLEWGIVDGVTTNQKIFLMERDVDFESRAKQICSLLVDLPVSLETTSQTFEELVSEAHLYASFAPNVVVKVAGYGDGTGLRVVRELTTGGIKTNMTVLMTTNQVLLAAKAGATYASIFFRRIQDAGEDPERVVRESVSIIDNQMKTKVIVGSMRDPADVIKAAVAGAHIITIPPKILRQMPQHSKSEETIKEFDKAWQEFKASSARKT